ncbi:uncharacterized protein [Magallana gigas]|uniref:uncharacterized protein n=1 Tax=Magallana gigas TaxID=29159 RepID=UPI00334130FB
MAAFSFVWIVVFSVFLFHCSEELIYIDVSSRSIPIGKSYLSVSCYDRFRLYVATKDSRPEMFLQFRQNQTSEWETIVEVNEAGTFLINSVTAIETDLERNKPCTRGRFNIIRCWIYANISIHLETCKDHIFPSLRCQLSNGTEIIERSRDLELEIKGKPTFIDSPSIVNSLTSKVFEPGEVLQLQCSGDKNFSTQTNTDIRWCKSASGQYEVISLQENPQTQIVSQREDDCTFVQKSEIFYHITDDDNDPEFMCELGYNAYRKICGKGRFNSTLRIPTNLKGDKWTLSPVIIYNEDSMLHPQNITIEGIGRTVQLLCVGSKVNQTKSVMEKIMWCIRKKNNTKWKPIVLQEDKIESMINTSGKITIYSKITYHLIGLDKYIDVMCQISSSTNCGSGEVSSTVSLQINPSELEDQYYPKQREIVEPERRESWLVVTTIISVTLLIGILFLLFGFVIKRKCKQVVTAPNEDYSNTELNRGCSPKGRAGDIYQNQHCSPTANESDNTYEMPLSPIKQPTYEEMNKSDVRKEEYEALSF